MSSANDGHGRPASASLESRRIEPVASQRVDPGTGAWQEAVRSFTPLGVAAEAFAKTLAYRIERKRLEVEELRIREQSAFLQEGLRAAFALQMEALDQRRRGLERFFDTVQEELERLHIERMTVLDMAKMATAKALAPETSMEQRHLFVQLASSLTATIPAFGTHASAHLRVVVDSLPPVQLPAGLLSSG